jgi:hypothetical protein
MFCEPCEDIYLALKIFCPISQEQLLITLLLGTSALSAFSCFFVVSGKCFMSGCLVVWLDMADLVVAVLQSARQPHPAIF